MRSSRATCGRVKQQQAQPRRQRHCSDNLRHFFYGFIFLRTFYCRVRVDAAQRNGLHASASRARVFDVDHVGRRRLQYSEEAFLRTSSQCKARKSREMTERRLVDFRSNIRWDVSCVVRGRMNPFLQAGPAWEL